MATVGPLRLAIYGKGGIGKSTVAANLTAAFAEAGAAVIQIGCDPKHDSIRLLLGGRRVATVLEHLDRPRNQIEWMRFRRKALAAGNSLIEVVADGLGLPEGMSRDDVLHRGYAGSLGIECGGPRPGVGCAGRGILTTFDLLRTLKVDLAAMDVVVYDVLGDVVCGGFGVPLRHEHADAILLVTSEEYMPVYAANNILRGVRGYDRGRPRVAGLLLNRRDNAADTAALRAFTSRVALPLLAELPRSPLLQDADRLGRTVIEAFPTSPEAAIFRALAHSLRVERTRHAAAPLADEELERLVLGREPPLPATAVAPALPATRASPQRQIRLAIYGKGGIGKSTIAANLSTALAAAGRSVLHIGCDPKHDSTRLLLGGRRVATVLEMARGAASSGLDGILHQGALGVHCLEIGGPEPGVGCAGRGILSAFRHLAKAGLDDRAYDAVIYDVLGDVVCGGFAVPVRAGHADMVLLATSEEFMPLYAANNILRGINGAAGPGPRVVGLFHNARGTTAHAAVDDFAAAVRLPIAARLERSATVQAAERVAQPLILHAPESAEAAVFRDLAAALITGPTLHPAAPVSDPRLEEAVLGRTSTEVEAAAAEAVPAAPGDDAGFASAVPDIRFCGFEHPPSDPFYYRIKPIRLPVMGCAFRAAADMGLKVRDAVVVVHAPRSCAFLCRNGLVSAASKALKREDDIKYDLLAPNLVCTDMGQHEMIHGGTELLAATLVRVLAVRPPVVFLATACPPAIIGDDIAAAIRRAQPVSPATRIVPLRSDGNLNGGGLNGWLSGLFDGILGLPRPEPQARQRPNTVNLMCDWDHEQSAAATAILAEIGVAVNVSFTVGGRDPAVADLIRLQEAPLTLMGPHFIHRFQMCAKFLHERFGTVMAKHYFPRGAHETGLWLREIGGFFGLGDRVEAWLEPRLAAYCAELAVCRRVLAGKRIVVFSRGMPMDWIFDVMAECGLEVVFFGLTARPEDMQYLSRHDGRLPIEWRFHPDRRHEIIATYRPDAVFAPARHELPPDTLTLDAAGVRPAALGLDPGRDLARRWARLFTARTGEAWRADFHEVDKRLVATAGGRS